jgi:outer membrane protein assembly factor BamB
MKTILTSIATGSLLAMLAVAQPPHSAVDIPTSPGRSLLVYVITGGLQFGAVDLHSGTFLPIGPALPPDVGGGLVQGPDKSLLTLAFSGNLVAIDPVTGKTSTVGGTGLGDCTTPSSPCGPNSANGIGRFDQDYYLTDFANNLYSVDPESGAAKLIGLTGIPALPFSPLSVNPDGSQNVFNETLFSARGKLYANFAAAVRPQGGPPVIVIPPAIWEINPKTGNAKWIAPTELGLTSIVNVNETIYAFSVRTGQVVILDVSTGQTSAVIDLDLAAGLIGGATPARPVPAAGY